MLIYNAIKYTNAGDIRVNVSLIGLHDNSLLRINIIDTGCGMSEELTIKLFSLFSNVKYKKQVNQHGIGLGLSKCKMIVGMLGGVI